VKTKPNVRPPVAGHPDSRQRETPHRYPPMDPRAMTEDIARRLFREKGGDGLMQDIRSVEDTLLMYQQDVDRGLRNENPEKFRWRVNPGVAARLRKELRQLQAELRKVMAECKAEAEKVMAETYPPPKTDTPAPQADVKPAQPAGKTEKEAAPSAPTREAA
jgi:hypothetical protein